ncbi:MAG: site-specific DNA-methyltransferase [Candidatus Heimdallarchaeota archaeon]|nr:MAG: site-specific DNA-methyltransferase [Candidatus Heimdallarchaeota archaeon]
MTVIEKCELIWRGKKDRKGKPIDKPRTLKVIQSIHTPRFAKTWRNKLATGDNIFVIKSLLKDFTGKINLVYIDPPFGSGTTYKLSLKVGKTQEKTYKKSSNTIKNGFNDIWGETSLDSYLTFMFERLVLIHELLATTGSIFVHLDWHTVHYVKVIMDEIFGRKNFRGDIIWQRTPGHHLSSTMDVMTDVILWYSKTDNLLYHQQYQYLTDEELNEKFPYTEAETGRRFTHEKLEQSANAYSIGEKRIIDGRVVTTKLGWRWTQETFDRRIKENPYLIFWTSKGRPRYKRYADEYLGRKIGNLWTDIQSLASNDKERIGYPTQKPEALLKRIIKMTTNEGDLVVDFFCGSGTTLTVAEKLNRRWMGVDSSEYAIELTRKRLLTLKGSKDLLVEGLCYEKETNPFEILTLD